MISRDIREPCHTCAVRHVISGDVVMGKRQQAKDVDRLRSGGHIVEERLAILQHFFETTVGIGIIESFVVDKAQDVDDLGQSLPIPGLCRISIDQPVLYRTCFLKAVKALIAGAELPLDDPDFGETVGQT